MTIHTSRKIILFFLGNIIYLPSFPCEKIATKCAFLMRPRPFVPFPTTIFHSKFPKFPSQDRSPLQSPRAITYHPPLLVRNNNNIARIPVENPSFFFSVKRFNLDYAHESVRRKRKKKKKREKKNGPRRAFRSTADPPDLLISLAAN